MKKRLLTILVMVAATEHAAAVSNTFDWCVARALEARGIAASEELVCASMGVAFAPVVVTGIACFSRSQQAARIRLLDNAEQEFGVVCSVVDVTPTAWKNALFRRSLGDIIQQHLDSRNAVLVEGAWQPATLTRQWGVLHARDERRFSGDTMEGASELRLMPDHVVAIATTNVSRAPGAQLATMLETAARLMAGVVDGDGRDQDMLTGTHAVDWLADAAHRQPWCFECGQASTLCLAAFLRAWQEDAQCGAAFLRQAAKEVRADKAATVSSAAAAMEKVVGVLAALSDEDVVRRRCADASRQAAMGEEIRTVNRYLAEAARCLGQDIGPRSSEVSSLRLDALYLAALPKTAQAALQLPSFGAMEDGNRSFLCSLLVAERLGGSRRKSEWAKAVYRNPFAVAVPVSLTNEVRDVVDEYAAGREMLASSGMKPVVYIRGTGDVPSVRYFLRRAFAEAIARGMVVVEYGVATSAWGLVVHSMEQGRSFGYRTPADTGSALRITTDLPAKALVLERISPGRSERAILIRLLRAASATSAATNGVYLAGMAGIDHWIAGMNACATSAARPSLSAARWNESIWTSLIERRREAYRFLELTTETTPEVVIELLALRNMYVREVNELQAALTDGYVLRPDLNGKPPVDWQLTGSSQQLATMERVRAIERDALGQLTLILTRLDVLEKQTPRALMP